MKTFLLLGSGELGKEFTISAKRYGHRVIAGLRSFMSSKKKE